MRLSDFDPSPWNLVFPLLLGVACAGRAGDDGETDGTSDGGGFCINDTMCPPNWTCINNQCQYYYDDGHDWSDEHYYYECYSGPECGEYSMCVGNFCSGVPVVEDCVDAPGLMEIPLPDGADAAATALHFVDTDKDGYEDLITAAPGSATLIRMQGQEAIPLPLDVLPQPVQIVSGDFDDDGNVDLAFADGSASHRLDVLLADGMGGFMVGPEITLPWPVADAVAGDFDGNGSVEIAVSYEQGLRLLQGDGTGNFTPGDQVMALANSKLSAGITAPGATTPLIAQPDNWNIGVWRVAEGAYDYAIQNSDSWVAHDFSYDEYFGSGTPYDLVRVSAQPTWTLVTTWRAGGKFLENPQHMGVSGSHKLIETGSFGGGADNDLVLGSDEAELTFLLIDGEPPDSCQARVPIAAPAQIMVVGRFTGDENDEIAFTDGQNTYVLD